jgi:alpha/beta superfamily hydrolase
MNKPQSEEETLLITMPTGQIIETRIGFPQQPIQPKTLAVICHPHPLFGGTMDNKVVYILTSTLRNLGAITVRFNFRGIGKSTGVFDQGIGESDDLVFLINWLQQHYSTKKLWLAGFSFGSFVAFRAHEQIKPERLILVAPAVERWDYQQVSLQTDKTLIVQGGNDTVVFPPAVMDWVGTLQPAPHFEMIEEADHFFHGFLPHLREIVQKWMA